MRSKSDAVNFVNIGLMIAACAAAYVLPFELFLFSYAILGPLHYLTQISWLHDRGYFTRNESNRRGWLAMVGAAMAVVVYTIIAGLRGREVAPAVEIALFYLTLIGALIATDVLGPRARIAIAITAVLLLLAWSGSRSYVIVAFFLITIIHVFLFTGLFIVYGAIKSRSVPALLSLVVFAACTAICFLVVPVAQAYRVHPWAAYTYESFNALNLELIRLLNLGSAKWGNDVYQSRGGLMVMRFIAFAYTYHYLNWFSKTTVIGWHRSALPRARWIVAAWIAALTLYAWDFTIGMSVLYALSILHVMLEFPLDYKTFHGIGAELRMMASRAKPDMVSTR